MPPKRKAVTKRAATKKASTVSTKRATRAKAAVQKEEAPAIDVVGTVDVDVTDEDLEAALNEAAAEAEASKGEDVAVHAKQTTEVETKTTVSQEEKKVPDVNKSGESPGVVENSKDESAEVKELELVEGYKILERPESTTTTQEQEKEPKESDSTPTLVDLSSTMTEAERIEIRKKRFGIVTSPTVTAKEDRLKKRSEKFNPQIAEESKKKKARMEKFGTASDAKDLISPEKLKARAEKFAIDSEKLKKRREKFGAAPV